jgi:hypothetical protein
VLDDATVTPVTGAYRSAPICGSSRSNNATKQFNGEHNHAQSFRVLLYMWLYTNLTAHTLCIYPNRLLDNVDFLQIKQFAFPTNLTLH